ncbi:DUF6221 family protein [Nonomuraea sp. NPDC059194]|uniref:DUF6221 family protein n=1 Tax=Nonomuraea sp. NPDC059194 TaxID=3346764 RepID=UPI0036C84316
MTDLATFLNARFDEAEEWVKKHEQKKADAIDGMSIYAKIPHMQAAAALGAAVSLGAGPADPRRVQRDIEAKRRILVRCQEEMLSGIPRLVHFAKQTLWEMAQPDADHPDFREEWKP